MVLLRDDRDYLKRLLPAAIARYLAERVRVAIVMAELAPGNGLVRAILDRVWVGGGGTQEVQAPITTCGWDFQARTTRVSAGQAQR